MNNDYMHDLYIENFTYPIDIYYKKDVIKNTVDFYQEHHPTFNIKAFNQLSYNTIEQIIKYDKTINIHNQNIYKELYKILYLIDVTFNTLKFIKQVNYPKKHFANIQSDKKKIKSEVRNYKKLIVLIAIKVFV